MAKRNGDFLHCGLFFCPVFTDSGGGRRGGDRAGGFGLVTGSLRCLIKRESYPAVLEGQKVLH